MKVENLSLKWDKIVRYKFKLKREFMKFMNKFKYRNEINKLSKIMALLYQLLIESMKFKKEFELVEDSIKSF